MPILITLRPSKEDIERIKYIKKEGGFKNVSNTIRWAIAMNYHLKVCPATDEVFCPSCGINNIFNNMVKQNE